jgi:catalase
VVRDAFGHLKVTGFSDVASPIFEAAGLDLGGGMVVVDWPKGIAAFIAAAKGPRMLGA